DLRAVFQQGGVEEMRHPPLVFLRKAEREEGVEDERPEDVLLELVPGDEAGETQVEQLVSRRVDRLPELVDALPETRRFELRRLLESPLDRCVDRHADLGGLE